MVPAEDSEEGGFDTSGGKGSSVKKTQKAQEKEDTDENKRNQNWIYVFI